jgi:PPOX class probable F420-dependent enzyme
MAIALPQSVKKILQDKAYGHVITFDAAGKPQVTMVWMDVDGDEVVFNTAEGRLKPKNLRRDPRVIVSVQDRNDPQSYMVFHGKATLTESGADAQIDQLARRFLGLEKYPFRRPGEVRLQVRIKVDRIGGYGPKMQPWV